MTENIAFNAGECRIDEDKQKITCKIGNRLTNPDIEAEIDMSGKLGTVDIENEDVDIHTNTQGDVKVEGGSQSDENMTADGRISRSYRNREIYRLED